MVGGREFHKEITDTRKEDLWETDSVRGTSKTSVNCESAVVMGRGVE